MADIVKRTITRNTAIN